MKKNLFVLFGICVMLAGCGPKEETPSGSATSSPAAQTQANLTVDPATTGTLKGVVSLEGAVPVVSDISVRGNPECAAMHAGGKIPNEEYLVKDGKVQNVFVYLKKGLESYRFDTPTQSAEVDNENCQYTPRVSGAQVGQPIIFLNSDATLHNVHAYGVVNKGWNIGLPFKSSKQTKRFDQQEVMVTLKCDVHPWMRGYLGVLPHPYFAVTGPDGSFALPNVPEGRYEIEVWHEKLGTLTQTVELKAKEDKAVEFKFQA